MGKDLSKSRHCSHPGGDGWRGLPRCASRGQIPIRDAEMILVMNHGSIVEKGTHEELLAKGGFYAELYNSQFTGRTLQEEAV
jgi:hypothetical protein